MTLIQVSKQYVAAQDLESDWRAAIEVNKGTQYKGWQGLEAVSAINLCLNTCAHLFKKPLGVLEAVTANTIFH